MPMRAKPTDYFNAEYPPTSEVSDIPTWVPILLGICIIGAFAVAIYAISKMK